MKLDILFFVQDGIGRALGLVHRASVLVFGLVYQSFVLRFELICRSFVLGWYWLGSRHGLGGFRWWEQLLELFDRGWVVWSFSILVYFSRAIT